MQLEQLWSPLGIISILLAGGGVFLIIWNFFRPELSFADKEAIVKQRHEDLPLLRRNIDAILKRQKELALEIGKTPLDSFFNEYLQINEDYKRHKKILRSLYKKDDEQTIHKKAIFRSIAKFFFPKTIHLNNVCLDDRHMSQLNAERDIYYHRNNDKKLSGIIDDLLDTATKYHSILSFAGLATHSGLHYKSVKYYAVFQERPKLLKREMTRLHKKMNGRIDLLTRGEDL